MNAQDNIVERVKAGNPIEDVIEESGYALERRHGKYVRSREHDSLVVNTRNQTYSWNSMSEIQEDVIAWVMHRNNWDFKAAMEWLARRAHLPEPKWSREDQAVREASRKREGIFQVAQQAMQRWLWADEEALGYCRGRGWTDETIRESGLGFSGRDPAAASLDLRGDFLLHDVDPECPQAAAILGWRGNVREWAAKWGMDLSEEVDWVKGGYLPGMIYKTRLVYAHYVNGKVQTFSGRNILGAEVNKEGREVKSYNLPRALAGERQVFYNHEYSTRAEELVIVEGQADAITLGQWGIPAVAMCGTAWQDKERLLEELGERHGKVYIGLDADQAGEKALRGRKDDWPLAGILGPMARVVRWPESDGGEGQKGKDANDWLRWGMKAMGLTDYNGEIIRQTLETEDQGPEIDAELLLQAVKVVREDKKASVSHLERAMKIGFPRATRLMEELEKAGVIGPADENGHRAVLEEGANDSNTAAEDPDRRREWVERLVKRQSEKAREWINLSLTMAEEAAQWAGKQKGGERDEAIRTAFGIIARMDKVQMATYRASLTAKLEMGIREFNDILKAAGQEIEDAPVLTVETLGGWIDGWLLEYIYDPKEETARLAWRDPDRKMGISEYVDIEGLRYVPRHVNNFVRDGGCLFASEIGGLKSTKELVTLVEMFLNQHYLLENKYLSRIIAYYVLLTWVYDCFNALPYLRAMGEAGAGKSELMRRIGHLCYRMMAASGANTAASFFRATETYRGTVFVDEADLYDGGDMSNDLVKFLNLGAMKGNPIWRLEEVLIEGGKSYEVATFSTFCPKLIAMRKDFKDDAVASRSLTIKLMPREPIELKARGIRLYIDEEFREKARAIRNLLLRWRFEKWEPEITVGEEHMDLDISSRLNQVTMPLKALAKDDPSLQGEIEKFLRAYNQDMVLTRSMTIAARAVEAMWKIWTEKSYRDKYLQAAPEGGGWWMMIGDVAKCANEIMDEMNALGTEEEESEEGKKKRKKDSLTARGIGSLIRNELQLQVGERRGKGFPVYWDELKMQALAKRYGVRVPSGAEGDGQAVGNDPPEPDEPAAQAPAQTPKQSEIPF